MYLTEYYGKMLESGGGVAQKCENENTVSQLVS